MPIQRVPVALFVSGNRGPGSAAHHSAPLHGALRTGHIHWCGLRSHSLRSSTAAAAVPP
jgi:hypothetical protein